MRVGDWLVLILTNMKKRVCLRSKIFIGTGRIGLIGGKVQQKGDNDVNTDTR